MRPPTSPPSNAPESPPLPPRLAAFFEVYLTDGPGWTPADRAFAQGVKCDALRMAAQMLAGEPGYFFSLLGQTSIGKTMLARLLMRFWCRYVAYATYGDGREPPSHYARIDWPTHDWREIEDEKGARCMMIDEIGRGERGRNGPDWSRLIDLLNYREQRRLWTIITANLTWDEIRKSDAAIAERLRRNQSVVWQAGPEVKPFNDRKI